MWNLAIVAIAYTLEMGWDHKLAIDSTPEKMPIE